MSIFAVNVISMTLLLNEEAAQYRGRMRGILHDVYMRMPRALLPWRLTSGGGFEAGRQKAWRGVKYCRIDDPAWWGNFSVREKYICENMLIEAQRWQSIRRAFAWLRDLPSVSSISLVCSGMCVTIFALRLCVAGHVVGESSGIVL